MDLDALGKKGKGKGDKGKGKTGKGKRSAYDLECFYCGRKGHPKFECRTLKAHREAKNIQPDRAGKSKGTPVDKETGKRAAGKKERDVAALYEDDEEYEENDYEGGYVFALTEVAKKIDEEKVMDICALFDEGECFDLLFDTAAARSVILRGMAADIATKP